MLRRKNTLDPFLADFSQLEHELGRGVACPLERMVVELRLTPARVRKIEQHYGTKLPWFAAIYSTLKRHQLLGKSTSWADWLHQYRLRRSLASRPGAA